MITRNVTVYLGEGYPTRIPVSQYDTIWRFVFTVILDDEEWTIPSNASVVMNGRKPDGNVFALDGVIEGNRIIVDSTSQLAPVYGEVYCELSIAVASAIVGTANFIIDVEQAPKTNDSVISESALDAYGELIQSVATIEGHMVPAGGDAGKVLGKASDDDYDAEWQSASFFATYGVTSYADISAAYTAGKDVLLLHKPATTTFVMRPTSVLSNKIVFGCLVLTNVSGGVATYSVRSATVLNDNTWSYDSMGLSSNMVSDVTINSSSIVSSGTAVIPVASSSDYGVCKVDTKIVSGGTDPVEGGEIYDALSEKADSSSVHSIPSGGASGYVLKKASATDYDVAWAAESGGGGGGGGDVSDVTIDGSSIVSLGVAAIPIGGYNNYGVVKLENTLSTSSLNGVQNAVVTAALNTKYVKPSGGIPATDLASGVIPSVPSAYTSAPAALGTASAGSSTSWAKGDHVHPKPTASDIGAIAAPSSPATGAFLVYNGSAWTAQTLSTWQGGNY